MVPTSTFCDYFYTVNLFVMAGNIILLFQVYPELHYMGQS